MARTGMTSIVNGCPALPPMAMSESLFDCIPSAHIDDGVVKFLTVRLEDDREGEKVIVRGYEYPVHQDGHKYTLDELPNGIDEFVYGLVERELNEAGVRFHVIGAGKLLHLGGEAKTVIFYEEHRELFDRFSGMSEQVRLAKELIDSGKYKEGYRSEYVEDRQSPDSFTLEIEALESTSINGDADHQH